MSDRTEVHNLEWRQSWSAIYEGYVINIELVGGEYQWTYSPMMGGIVQVGGLGTAKELWPAKHQAFTALLEYLKKLDADCLTAWLPKYR